MRINVKFQTADLKREFPRLRRKVQQAEARAINRSMTQVKNEGAPIIAEKFSGATTQAQIKKVFKIKRATTRHLIGVMSVTGGPLPLALFKARQTARGVTYVMDGKRRLLQGAFIAKTPTGHRGVFVRSKSKIKRGTSRAVKKGGHIGKIYKPQLTIKERKGPSIPMAMEDTEELLYTIAARIYPTNVNRELRYYLGQAWGK